MAVENVVIGYRADISDIKRQVKLLERINARVAKNLGKDFTKGATIVKDELIKIKTVAKGIKLPLGGVSKQVKQFATVLRLANGQLVTVRSSVAGTGKNIKTFNTTVSKGATVSRTFGQNLATLAKRAALTIPLWFALRQGIGSVFRTIKEGLSAIVSFDRALQKARRNLQGSAEDIKRNFGILKDEVTKLSIETGRSVEDITNAFQKFATVGFDFEASLSGANSATKLSILLFGEVQETATAFARAMRVLVDESKDAKPAGEQLAEVMALTSELWKTNAFELNELTASLERFAPVAKTAGFSAEEAVKLMAGLSTAGLRGSKAGRLLSTSLVRMVTKTDELAKSLGIKVNPEMDRTFDIFLKTLDALQKTRSEAGKVSPEFEKIVKSIFGLRSGLAVKGLIALRKNLQDILGVTVDVANFTKEFEELNKTTFQLVAQFQNLNKEIGKAFVTGLVGAKDFDKSLEKLSKIQKKILDQAESIARAVIISGQVSFGDVSGVTRLTTLSLKEVGLSLKDIIFVSRETEKALDKFQKRTLNNTKKLLKGLEGQLDRANLERLIVEIETDIKLDTKQFTFGKDILIKAKKALEGLFEDLEPIEPTLKITLDQVEITTEQQNKLIKAIIKDQLERLRLEGATESQLLKIKDRLIRQTDINDGIINQKKRQLEIERKMNEEQKKSISFTSNSVKLAQIAKNEGISSAKIISEVVSGQRDFNTFIRRGGKEAEILKTQFADFVKQQELLKFFTGRGATIQIEEKLGQKAFTPIRAETQIELTKARIGLKESTDQNKSAIQENTTSIGNLIRVFEQGGTLFTEDLKKIRSFFTDAEKTQNIPRTIANLPVSQVTSAGFQLPTQKQTIDFNITIDGQNLDLIFRSKEEARTLLSNLLSDKSTIDRIVNTLPFKEAVNGQIEEF